MREAPIISGEGLRLRPHVMADMEAFGAFYRSARAEYMDVPGDATEHWYRFASEVGSWPLKGMGGWAIDVDGRLVGQVAIIHPPHFSETEIGWFLLDGYEGRGIAYVAARLALDFARAVLKPVSLVSYIDGANRRSIRLAERLGATPDPDAARHDAEDVVYRHAVAA